MPDPLYLNWSDVSTVFHGSTANNQLLLNLDCCNAGSANMKEDVEVMGASVWDGMAASNPDFSFSGALIKELNLNKGRVVTSAQLIARMQHNADSKFRQAAMPFHRPSVIENKLPVLFYGVRKPHLVEGNQMTSMGQLPVQQSWKDVLQGAGKLIIALLVGLLIVIAFQGPKAPRCS